MRITLVRPPYYSLFGIKNPTYPLGLAYISAFVRQKGIHEVFLVDGETGKFDLFTGFLNNGILADIRLFLDPTNFFRKNFDVMTKVVNDPEHKVWKFLVQEIIKTKPDLVGFSCYTTDVVGVKILANLVKKTFPDIPIVLGGPHVNALPVGVLDFIKSADYAIFGEGEETFSELLNLLSNGKSSIETIAGLVYRKNGHIKKNESRLFRQDMDLFPFPDRTLGYRGNYKYDDLITTSRGCPFKCIYCTSRGTWRNKVRFRSVENVIQEIRLLRELFDTQRITLIDDTFTFNKRHVITLCQAIIDNGLNKIDYSATSRVDTLDEERIEMLVAAGIKTLRFGIESGSTRILKLVKKDIELESAINVLELCRKYGIDSMTYFMVGHPTETIEDVEMSIKFFEQLNPTRGYVMMSTPFPDTPLYEYAVQHGKTVNLHDYYKFSLHGACVANISAMTDEELEKMFWKFHERIEARGYYKKRKLIIETALKPKKLIKFFFRNSGVKPIA